MAVLFLSSLSSWIFLTCFADNKKQFSVHTDVDTYGLPYDYHSVMHYPVNAFAINNSIPTIVPRLKNTRFGEQRTISPLDAVKLQKAYKCFPNQITIDDAEEEEERTDEDQTTEGISTSGLGALFHFCCCGKLGFY